MERFNFANNSQAVRLIDTQKVQSIAINVRSELGNSCPRRKEEPTISLIKFYEDEDGREYFAYNQHILVD